MRRAAFLPTLRDAARVDIQLLHARPRFVAACLVMLVVPAMYALIYLSSLWDPAAHTKALHVVVVNDDAGTTIDARPVSLGAQIVEGLNRQDQFTVDPLARVADARRAVVQGDAAFAILIPPDFSREAMSGARAGAGRIVIFLSEGNNYTGAGFARRFAPELARHTNQALNTQRWETVLHVVAGSSERLGQLRAAFATLAGGAGELDAGLAQAHEASVQLAAGSARLAQESGRLGTGLKELDAATGQLARGLKELGRGLREMNARWPAHADLAQLRAGTKQVREGQAALGRGLGELRAGTGRLRAGVAQLVDESSAVPFVGTSLSQGAAQIGDGVAQIEQGLDRAQAANGELGSGDVRIERGVGQLVDGVEQLGAGVERMVRALPADAKLDQLGQGATAAAQGGAALQQGATELSQGMARLDEGLGRLAAGVGRLKGGIDTIRASLPEHLREFTGSAQGLAESVQPALEVAAPVRNQGTAFTPNFVPLSQWIGASLASFLFAMRRLPLSLEGRSRFGLLLGKMVMPSAIVIGQALVILLMLQGILAVSIDSPWRFSLTVFATGLSFLALIFALVRVMGDAGKLVAMLLLIVQIASAGATIPIELTSGFYQAIHPWLPLSWVVKALRVTMFGAYGGEWGRAFAFVVLAWAVSLLVAAFGGRWAVVPDDEYGPGIDNVGPGPEGREPRSEV